MISELIDRDSFTRCLKQIEIAMANRSGDLKGGDTKALIGADVHGLNPSDMEDALQTVRAFLNEKLPNMKDDRRDAAWIARDPFACIMQSFLDEYLTNVGAVVDAQGQGLQAREVGTTNLSLDVNWGLADPQGLLKAMEMTDPKWAISFAAAKALKSLRGQRAFPTHVPRTATLGNRARVILVGDWGSGVPRAIKVGERMRERLFEAAATDRDRHVIHLGDVYYSGFESEYKKRFLPHWPVKVGEQWHIGSWCLNANHDMFTGGYGYFDFLLKDPRFARQGETSYFALENDHWQIIGLDTGYDSPDPRGSKGNLFGSQGQWVKEKRAKAPTKKAVFLSHHQLFSPYEGGSPLLEEKLSSVIQDPNGIKAWFWAHEHRCVMYDGSHAIRNARLVGHGGVPVYASDGDLPGGVTWEFRESFREGIEKFARFGFAILDFDSDALSVQYVGEDGAAYRAEVIK